MLPFSGPLAPEGRAEERGGFCRYRTFHRGWVRGARGAFASIDGNHPAAATAAQRRAEMTRTQVGARAGSDPLDEYTLAGRRVRYEAQATLRVGPPYRRSGVAAPAATPTSYTRPLACRQMRRLVESLEAGCEARAALSPPSTTIIQPLLLLHSAVQR